MTTTERDRFRTRLVKLADRLSRKLSSLKTEALQSVGGEPSGGFSDLPVHLGDPETHAYEEEMNLALVGREEQILADVNAALERIEAGTFGRCEACGMPIAKDRLQALPYTRFCIGCASQSS
jgi:RNA polymerase-binding protein DksA